MKYKNKIAVIICYYGSFPWYFPYFLHSCKFNESIDFFIFSDITHKFQVPPNVKIIHKSIEEIKELASKN